MFANTTKIVLDTMEKTEFLEKNVFQNLKNLNEETSTDAIRSFSEAEFAVVLERIEQFGIGIYKIETQQDGKSVDAKINEDYRKKATDPKWYKRAFFELKKNQPNLHYTATYRVSERLLNRKDATEDSLK